jgi:D-cysteine desulfhydrase
LKISAVAGLGLAASQSRRLLRDFWSDAAPAFRGEPLKEEILLRLPYQTDTSLALTRRYPWLRFGEKSRGRIQIANICSLPEASGISNSGLLGERMAGTDTGDLFLPWAPLFRRPTPVYEANSALKALAGTSRLYIKDEGNDVAPLYGNKIRKYEFLLPNLALCGVKKVYTHGAFGSNHCAQLVLAARFGTFRPMGVDEPIDVELMLYPQEITEDVITKLKLLVASGARLRFLEGDGSVGLSIFMAQVKPHISEESTEAYVPPGGSSPLTVLGHVEALMELAEEVENGDCPLETAPDYIFVPLGSGATTVGLVLGCRLLGWPTKVVGTCSQEKSWAARLAVNGDSGTPFLVANAQSLMDKALVWLNRMGLAPDNRQAWSARDLIRQGLLYDDVSWNPEYGKVTPEVRLEETEAADAGLILDETFTAKSFHTLKLYAENGLLQNKSALFWNTYQRFPLNTLLPEDQQWIMGLPEPIRERVEAYWKIGREAS